MSDNQGSKTPTISEVELIQVTDKRDGKVKAVLSETDETVEWLKKSGFYKFKKIKK